VETQAPYIVVIPGVTGPTYTEAVRTTTGNIHLSYLPEVHGAVALAEVPANRVLGVDVSHWQARRDVVPVIHMDWAKCKQAGAQFAFIRAGSINAVNGICYEDYEFQYNSGVAPDLMPVGYYWYWRPQFSGLLQANYFCDLIENKNWRIPPWADIEAPLSGMSKNQATDRLEEFVEQIGYRIGYPAIYTRGYYWNDNIDYRQLWGTLDLAIARYTDKPEPWGNPGDEDKLRPRDWNDWLFWQWSADRPPNGRGAEFGAQSNSIDLDYYNGNQDDFEDEFGLGLSLEEKVERLWQAHPGLWDPELIKVIERNKAEEQASTHG